MSLSLYNKKIASLLSFACLTQTFLTPFAHANIAPYTIDSTFTTNVIQNNQAGQAEVKASITLRLGDVLGNFPFGSVVACINQNPGPSPSVYMAYSVVVGSYFVNFRRCAYTPVARKGTTFIEANKFNYPSDTANSTADMIAALVALGNVNNDLAISSPAANQLMFTRIGAEPGGALAFFDSIPSSGYISSVASVTGVPYLASQTAQVDFTPMNVSPNDTFEMTINGNTITATGASIAQVTANLVSAYNTSPSSGVTCADNTTKVTCTGANDTVSITASSRVIYGSSDTTAPQLTLVGSSPVTVQYGNSYTEDGATWIDNRDGSGSIASPYSGTVDTNRVGTYTLAYQYADSASNTGTITRTVNVVDQTPPVISVLGSGSITQELDLISSYVDAGATWTDNVDGSGTLTASGLNLLTATGVYNLTYSYTDASQNTATGTRTVTIVDSIPPVVTITTSPTTINANSYRIMGSASGAQSVTVTGGSGGSIVAVQSGNNFSALVPLTQNAVNTLLVTARDASGNIGTGSVNITESGSLSSFSGTTTVSGSTLANVSTITGTGVTAATQIRVEQPVSFGTQTGGAILPSDTVITSASGTSFDATSIVTRGLAITGGLASNETSNGALEFGISSVGLHFSKPVRIDISLSGYLDSTIPVRVRHGGSSDFVTTGLTADPTSTCTNGVSSNPSSTATVSGSIATIYTCAASTFVGVTVTPSSSSSGGGGGGASSPIVGNPISTTVPSSSIPSGVLKNTIDDSKKVVITEIDKNHNASNFRIRIENIEKVTTVNIPTQLDNGTKVTIRIKLGKIYKNKITTKVKDGKITFRTKTAGIYQIIKNKSSR